MTENVLDLDAFSATLRYARRALGPDATLQRLLILLAVHRHEGASQNELLAQLESTSITALSRNLADLSALTSRKTAGPGLVELRIDAANLRRKQVWLTPKGRRLFARWPKAAPMPAAVVAGAIRRRG